MSTIVRGVVRPDRVYQTGVLSPMIGYQPQADVQDVMAAFTKGPPSATILSSGLGGLGAGPLQRFGLRVKAFVANLRAQRAAARAIEAQAAVSAVAATAPTTPAPSIPVAPEMRNAHQVAPQIATQMQMLHQLGPEGNMQQAWDVLAQRRYLTYYRAG